MSSSGLPRVRFHKMHGLGNDFVLLDLRDQACAMDAERARRIAQRRTGVGCDQLLVLHPPRGATALARFEVWNSDGSQAEQCGNGVRAIGHYLHLRGEAGEQALVLEGPVADIGVQCLGDGQVTVDMGRPDFRPARVPVSLEPDNGAYRLEIDGREIEFGAVSMGNPHAVIEVADLDAAPVAELGATLGAHPAFPQGCNVGFVQIEGRDRVRLRVRERGAGETRACGSGACAAMAVLRRAGKVDRRVIVQQAGGGLIIDWGGESEPMEMTGPAVHVFEGTLG